MAKKIELTPGRGLDAGTCFFVSSVKNTSGEVVLTKIRDSFIDVPDEPFIKNTIKMSGAKMLELNGQHYIIGDESVNFANLLKREARRPLKDGLISPEELAISGDILAAIIKSLLGDPVKDGEVVCYSIPADPVDNKGVNNIYHTKVLERLVSSAGFRPVPINEAMAIIYSECQDSNFTGLSLSFGGGMVNVCLSYMTMPILQFSIQGSGDQIDASVARALSTTASRVQIIKEKGVDLMANDFATKEEEAIAFYYQALIERSVNVVVKEIKNAKVELSDPLPIVIAGGTSLAGGFVDLFKKVFEKNKANFPFEVKEIRHASDPLTAVARGLMVAAQLEDSE